jgi:O-methyltransferase
MIRWLTKKRSSKSSGELQPSSDMMNDELDAEIIKRAKPFTMTGLERLFALVQAVRYIVRAEIPGDLVECGVWKGGSMIAAASTLLELKAADRNLWLYDTFEGMPEPTVVDVSHRGENAQQEFKARQKNRTSGSDWCYSSLEEVRENLEGTNYPKHLLRFVKGKVEETIPREAPAQIALLRLDTDWYESTKHELVHLFPRLSRSGVLIIDDYGYWKGCRKAVDEYFAAHPPAPLLNRIDSTGRIGTRI